MSKPQKIATADVAVVDAGKLSQTSAAAIERMRADAQDDGMAFDREDLAIPFVRIAQDLTPQTKKHEPSYIEGLKPGDFFHTVTRQVWPNENGGMYVIPISFARSFTEWTPREKGGGFVKDHGPDGTIMESTTRDAKNRDITPHGTQVTRAALYFVLVVNPETGETQQAALSLSGTQLKHAKKWNALISQYKAAGIPGYGKVYQLTTVIEKNDQGSWSAMRAVAYKNTLDLPNGDALYDMAKQYAALASAGEVKISMEKSAGDEPATDEKLPF